MTRLFYLLSLPNRTGECFVLNRLTEILLEFEVTILILLNLHFEDLQIVGNLNKGDSFE